MRRLAGRQGRRPDAVPMRAHIAASCIEGLSWGLGEGLLARSWLSVWWSISTPHIEGEKGVKGHIAKRPRSAVCEPHTRTSRL
ncbi:MAG: hypothetical protein H5T34_04010 [Candidatus Methanomethyliales bacterium]|nr:hypothetical protein [Candidatus Methanomethylicales archaeon]